MKKDSENTKQQDFLQFIQAARTGDEEPLNTFFKQLYEKGKHSLLRLTESADEAEEYFQAATAKFWEKCVHGNKELPGTNVEGYIYAMARFHYIDQQRKQSKRQVISNDVIPLENRMELSDTLRTDMELKEDQEVWKRQQKALRLAIKTLSENCQNLFKAILENGIEKTKELQAALGFETPRQVSILRYECNKRLKVIAAAEYERLLTAKKA